MILKQDVICIPMIVGSCELYAGDCVAQCDLYIADSLAR